MSAEQNFRQAFERLKADDPRVLEKGTPVTQNNVAKEAGKDTSALKKSRFPQLVREIQAYVELHQDDRPSQRQILNSQRKSRKNLRDRIREIEAERDDAQSQLASAIGRIVELHEELQSVRARLERLIPPPKPFVS